MIADKLVRAFPGKQWRLNHSKEGYAGLEWLDPSPKPTEREFTDALAAPTLPKESRAVLLVREIAADADALELLRGALK